MIAIAALASAWPLASGAGAVIHTGSVLDGPSSAILEVDGAAMAPDGTGGLLYRKSVGGIPHVFVVPFRNGAWGTPTQVDTEDPYGASQPAIAAGDNGRLLVVWVQQRNVSPGNVPEYELMSAMLPPGSSGFGQAIAVDLNVGEPDTGDASGVDPRLAMAPDGQAYVVYRARLDDCTVGDESNPHLAECRQGEKVVSVRVAQFDYLTWSSPEQVNRAPQVPMLNPTSENVPTIGIALNGNGVVAWQEPESSGAPARIWVRRLFGNTKGNVLAASPATIGGHPVTSDADAPTIGVGPFGETRIAFRILGGRGSAVPITQLFLNSMLSEIAPHGSELLGATPVAGAQGASLGPPSAAAISEQDFDIGWSMGEDAYELEGAGGISPSPFVVGAAAGSALVSVNPAGGGTAAWIAPAGAPSAVRVREDYAGGAYQTAVLAGLVSGEVSGLSLGGDSKGDALIAFMQGPVSRAEVVGAFVQAPPAPFVVNTPANWVRGGQADISWESAPDAVEGMTYSVYVDGRPRLTGIKGLGAHLSAAGLGDGVHRVQVLATDRAGQQTMSVADELKIDANPPVVHMQLIDHRHGVLVTVRDDASGVDTQATKVAFGDGTSMSGHARARHRYRHAGLYTITARVRDNVGNHAIVRLRVRAS